MTDAGAYDIVVVGSGIAGLSTALSAAKAGLRPVVVEKSDRIGGVSCWSYGAMWAPCTDQAMAAGIEDSAEAAEAYFAFLGAGEADPARARTLLHESARVLGELERAGIGFDLIAGVGDLLHGKAPGAVSEGRTLEPKAIAGAGLGAWREKLGMPPADDMWRVQRSTIVRLPNPAAVRSAVAEAVAVDQLASGPALVAGLLLALIEREVPIRLGTGVEALIVEHDRVVGVRTADGELRGALGVMLAAGGYLGNERLVATLDRIPGYRPYFPATSGGDSLILASTVGGSIRTIRNNVVIMLGLDDPDGQPHQAGSPSTRELPRAHTMIVNAAGRRFGNEVSFQELAPALRAMEWPSRTPANLPCWMIADQGYVDVWGMGGAAPGQVAGFVTSAGDLATLAGAAGIDAPGLVATVARFNGFAESGIDEDFGRRPGWAMVPGAGTGINPSLGAIARPPFHAVRLQPTLGAGGSGIKTDAHGRVLDWRDMVVPGLYSAGDAALHDEFGAGYQAGVTSASAVTFGWLAAEHMARAAKPPLP